MAGESIGEVSRIWGDIDRGQVESQCTGNSLEPMRVTIMRTHGHGGHGARSSDLLDFQ